MAKLSDKIKQSSVSDRIRVAILAELENISTGTTGLATEATALNILNAIVASGQDIEVLLVRDTGDSGKVLQQITDYINNTTVYKDVNGNIVVPVGPLEYLDPSAVLNLILTQNTSLNTPVNRTPTLVRKTDDTGSPVAAGMRRVCFFNAGNANGTVLGEVIKPGETIPFESGDLRDGLTAISYDGTGTELVITTVG